MLSDAEIEGVAARIGARLGAERVVVFGSYAKGIATIRSDLDLLVIAETELPSARRADAVVALLSASLIHIDVHVYTPEEVREFSAEPFSFLCSVLRTGRLVYPKE